MIIIRWSSVFFFLPTHARAHTKASFPSLFSLSTWKLTNCHMFDILSFTSVWLLQQPVKFSFIIFFASICNWNLFCILKRIESERRMEMTNNANWAQIQSTNCGTLICESVTRKSRGVTLINGYRLQFNVAHSFYQYENKCRISITQCTYTILFFLLQFQLIAHFDYKHTFN